MSEEFLKTLKQKRQSLIRKQKIVIEDDIKLSESLTRKIELCNIMITEFGGLHNSNSMKNLKHRFKF